jgi:hypothetical protein
LTDYTLLNINDVGFGMGITEVISITSTFKAHSLVVPCAIAMVTDEMIRISNMNQDLRLFKRAMFGA